MTKKLRAAVIGVGHLGKFHAEKFAQLENVDLIGVVDLYPDVATDVSTRLNTKAYTNVHDVLNHVDLVSIAVPTASHYAITKLFLENGIHVLLEKPMTHTLSEADDLITLAKANSCILQIGHIERFNPTVEGISKWLNNPRFIESHRLSRFQTRGTDISVILDLMIHDLDLILSLIPSPVVSIEAVGTPVLSKQIDIANARIRFANDCIADLTASRISLKTERKLRIFQPDTYIAANLHKKTAIKFHRTSNGDGVLPTIHQEKEKFATGDALFNQIAAFVHAVAYNQPPIVTAEDGKNALAAALQITECITTSLANINN